MIKKFYIPATGLGIIGEMEIYDEKALIFENIKTSIVSKRYIEYPTYPDLFININTVNASAIPKGFYRKNDDMFVYLGEEKIGKVLNSETVSIYPITPKYIIDFKQEEK
jgi:glutaredoxin-related protein